MPSQEYQIIGVSDARFMEDSCILNPKFIKTVHVFQIVGSGLDYDTCGLCISEMGNKAVLVKVGNMSFHSTGGGMAAANRFRQWLSAYEISHVFPCYMTHERYKALGDGITIEMDVILAESRTLPKSDTFEKRFPKWLSGVEDW